MPEFMDLKTQYTEYSTEYLLEMRARGDHLVPEAQRTIAEILHERGVQSPPIPSKPIILDASDLDPVSFRKTKSGYTQFLRELFFISAGMVLLFSLKEYFSTHMWFGAMVVVPIIAYRLARWLWRACRRFTSCSCRCARGV